MRRSHGPSEVVQAMLTTRDRAAQFLKDRGIDLSHEPSVIGKDGWYEDLRDLLADFADAEVYEVAADR